MKRLTKNEFINKAKKILGEEHYEFFKTTYVNIKTKTIITCKVHGDFLATPFNVLYKGCGCPLCSGMNISLKKTLTTEEFIKKAKTIHGDKYNYSRVNYVNSRTKIKIICPVHGVFEQTPNNHLRGCGCPLCNHTNNFI